MGASRSTGAMFASLRPEVDLVGTVYVTCGSRRSKVRVRLCNAAASYSALVGVSGSLASRAKGGSYRSGATPSKFSSRSFEARHSTQFHPRGPSIPGALLRQPRGRRPRRGASGWLDSTGQSPARQEDVGRDGVPLLSAELPSNLPVRHGGPDYVWGSAGNVLRTP